MDAGRAAVAAVWAAVLVAVVVILTAAPGAAAPTWLALAAGLAVVAAIVAQLLVGRQQGFVVRLAATSVGAFALVCAGALAALAGA